MAKLTEGLNDNQIAFCNEYHINNFNGMLAYRKAYPTCKSDETAMAGASRLLRDDKVKKYIENLGKNIVSKRIATLEDIQAFWTDTMNNNEDKKGDRLKASELLYRAKGGFVDKVENTVKTTFKDMREKYEDV